MTTREEVDHFYTKEYEHNANLARSMDGLSNCLKYLKLCRPSTVNYAPLWKLNRRFKTVREPN